MSSSDRYEVVKAKNHNEAVLNSPFFVGQKAEVSKVFAVANGDGTWTVFAEFKLSEQKGGQK